MGCICSCMKKKNKEGVKNEAKKKKKQRRWWRHIESSSQVTNTQSLNVSSSSITCSASTEGHLTRSNNKLPTEPKNTAGIVPGAADKDVCSVPMDRLPAVVIEGDIGVQSQNLQQLLPHIVKSERVTESGQGVGQGDTPTVSAVRCTKIRKLGFPNIGNTCYMNATLQCLLSLSCFWSPIEAQCSSWTDPSSCQMLRCFADLQQGRLTSCCSSKKKDLLGALNACISVRCPAFGEDYEQDAHEFLMMSLLQLKEEGETLRVSSFSYICPVANFEFHLKSVRTCSSCGLQSSREEDFNHLSVNLSSTLTDSLHSYFKSTDLEVKCDCGQGNKTSEAVEFLTLPRILILHIKRFDTLGQKLRNPMDIPSELDLSAFPGVASLRQPLSGPAYTQEKPHEKQVDNLEKSSLPEQVVNESREGQGEKVQHVSPLESVPTDIYRLHAVVSHLGSSMNNGHYISDVAEEKGERWLTFDDSNVSKIKEPTILKRRAKTAYLLFYMQSGAGEKNVVPWMVDQGEVAVSPKPNSMPGPTQDTHKKNKEGMKSEVKEKKKQKRWWSHIESSYQVTDTQSLNVSSSSITCCASTEGHLTRSNNKLPTEPKNTAGIVPGAADKDVCSVPMDRLPAVVIEGDIGVQSQNLQQLLPHIVKSETVTE
ncbi:ubiquitin carboxyl-terminal hydrolase 26-like [Brachyhypopomus gauderio]|uniref:ubiquitin carboxyl-terminal hydrolase 26-like n=1 Tax=Brachyhypopomus gauderio TaxID=698409 RepID=UPI004042BCAE